MVRQHNAASSDTDRLGAPRDVANANGSGSTGDASKVMVFSQPKAREAGGFGMLRQIEGVGQRISGSEAFADVGKVEHGELNHVVFVAYLPPSVSFYVQTFNNKLFN
jgi:hypothetical protein